MAPGFRRAGPSSPSCGGICPAMGTWFCGSGGGGFPGPKPRDDEPGGPWASFCPNRVENISVISIVSNTFICNEKAGFFKRIAQVTCWDETLRIHRLSTTRLFTSLWLYFHGPRTVIPDTNTHITIMTAVCWPTPIVYISHWHLKTCFVSKLSSLFSDKQAL